MNLLWLLLIPPFLFIYAAIVIGLVEFCVESDKWWGVPLYFAVGMPISAGGIAGIIGIIALAAGGL